MARITVLILLDANLLIYAIDADSMVGPGLAHWPLLRQLLREAGAAGNLTTDAHLAALAIEGGCELASTDHDFRRFAGVRLINPLAES